MNRFQMKTLYAIMEHMKLTQGQTGIRIFWQDMITPGHFCAMNLIDLKQIISQVLEGSQPYGASLRGIFQHFSNSNK